jgi:3-dehydroquinate synthase
MKELTVKIPAIEAGAYKIKIGTGILSSVVDDVSSILPGGRFFIITDKNVNAAGHISKLTGKIPEDFRIHVIDPPGEESKRLSVINQVLDSMEIAGMGRDTCVLAIGGGVVGDMAGFAASIFKRGVPVIQVPTTTISQADSAVGGKTGVDSAMSKNAFGTFWQPKAVYIDVATLQTLDERQFRSGLVESIKHALIADKDYFDFLEYNLPAILDRTPEVLEELAYRNCRIKASVVEKDPFETNFRRILNYGHSLGHAAESASNYQLLHGEAVAIGIIGAGMIGDELGLSNPSETKRIRSMLENLGVPVKIPAGIDKNRVFELLKHDKKAVSMLPRFVLLGKIGEVHTENGQYAIEVDVKSIRNVINAL